MDKDSFLKQLKNMTLEQLNNFIKEKGKPPKRVTPFTYKKIKQ